MKLKCTGAIAPTDKKQKPFFTNGEFYESVKSSGDVIVTGDEKRKSGSLEWQAVSSHKKGSWIVLGVATFEEVAQ